MPVRARCAISSSVDVDRVHEQQVGAEHALLGVDADGAHALDVVLRHLRVARQRQPLLARPGELALPDLGLAVLDAAAGDAQVQAAALLGEVLPAAAQDVVEVDRLGALRERGAGARVARRAVGVAAAQPGVAHRRDRGVGVRRRLHVVLPRVHRRDARVDGLGQAEADRRVGVVRSEVRAVGEHDVVEVVAERAVAGAAAQHRGPHVPVCVDQAGHDDAAGAVDHVGAVGGQVDPDVRDAVAVDQDVAAGQLAERGVHRQHVRPADEGARHALRLP